MKAEEIAEVCHEANRALTKHVGDVPVQPSWSESPEEMRSSSIMGVEYALANPNATPEDQHEAWCRDKRLNGWVYGDMKDSEKKTHPALKPYAELAEGTRRKDELFRAVVAALR